MQPVQLVVLQRVYVGYVVASYELVSFGILALTALVCVFGVACVEEGVSHAVVLPQCEAGGGQGCQFQCGGVLVITEVVLHASGGLKRLVEGIVRHLAFVAYAERCQQAEGLFPDGDVLACPYVARELRQGCASAHLEGSGEYVVLCDVVVEVGQTHVIYAAVQ